LIDHRERAPDECPLTRGQFRGYDAMWMEITIAAI
jgi:hypothetical protein